MRVFELKEEFISGIATIDNEHKIFFEHLKQLYGAYIKKDNVKKNLDIFFEDIKRHFANEEELMKRYKFFSFITHKMEHDRVLRKIEKIITNLEKDPLTVDFFDSMETWFVNHYHINDSKLVNHLRENGVK